MALKELNLKETKPKGINEDTEETNDDESDEDTLEIALEGDFDPNLGLSEDNTDEEESEESTEEEPLDDESDDDDYEARGERENDRIRTLIEERNAERKALAEERKQRIATQNRLIEVQKATVESGKSLLNSRVKDLKERLKKAHEDSDTQALVDIQTDLQKTQMDLTALEAWKEPATEELEEIEETVVEHPDDKFNQAPRAVKEWAKKNPWFRNPKNDKDRERQQETVLYSQILVNRGYKMDSDEFFEKMDERLGQLGLASKTKNNVKSKSKTKDEDSDGVSQSSGDEEQERKTSQQKPRKKISQRIQGASRTSGSHSDRKSRKITLTKDQQNIADLYGISYAEYAKELLKMEEAEKSGKRMVTTFE